MSVYLNKGEYAYYRLTEAAAWYFTARLIFAHQEYFYVAAGVLTFAAYEGMKALLQWRAERQGYKRLMSELDEVVSKIQTEREK